MAITPGCGACLSSAPDPLDPVQTITLAAAHQILENFNLEIEANRKARRRCGMPETTYQTPEYVWAAAEIVAIAKKS